MSGEPEVAVRQEGAGSPVSANWHLRTPLLAFVASRIWVALFVYRGHSQHPDRWPVIGGWSGVEDWYLNPWTTYDSLHFMNIAREGYTPLTAPFFPLYPFLLRLAGDDWILMALWGVVLSNVAFVLALIGLYRLVSLEHNPRTARLAVWITAFFPVSAYFSAVYSESIFLLFFVGALLFLRRRQFAFAAICGFLAALTRNAGVLLFVGFAVQYAIEYFQVRRGKLSSDTSYLKRNSIGAWAALLAPLAGFLVAQAIIVNQVGDAVQGFSAHQAYYRALTWPWLPIVLDTWDVVTFRAVDIVTILNLGVTVAALVLLWKYRRRQPISYSIMLLGLVLLQLTYSHFSLPRTQSSLRLLSTMVPFLTVLALEAAAIPWTKQRRVLAIAIALLVSGLCSYLFGGKNFLG